MHRKASFSCHRAYYVCMHGRRVTDCTFVSQLVLQLAELNACILAIRYGSQTDKLREDSYE
eukprot:scaffold67773_cov20-Prasinocladus_malaysianus.AAC.1